MKIREHNFSQSNICHDHLSITNFADERFVSLKKYVSDVFSSDLPLDPKVTPVDSIPRGIIFSGSKYFSQMWRMFLTCIHYDLIKDVFPMHSVPINRNAQYPTIISWGFRSAHSLLDVRNLNKNFLKIVTGPLVIVRLLMKDRDTLFSIINYDVPWSHT